jgi:hypothetical protein
MLNEILKLVLMGMKVIFYILIAIAMVNQDWLRAIALSAVMITIMVDNLNDFDHV